MYTVYIDISRYIGQGYIDFDTRQGFNAIMTIATNLRRIGGNV